MSHTIIFRSEMLDFLSLASIIARKSKAKIIELDSVDLLQDSEERETTISILKFLKTQSEFKEYVSLLGKKVHGKIRLYDIQEVRTQSNECSKYNCYSIDWLLGENND